MSSHFGRLGIETLELPDNNDDINECEDVEEEGVNLQDRVTRFLQEIDEINSTAAANALEDEQHEQPLT